MNGGDADCWKPDVFFPHITIGYTHNDIHAPKIEKDMDGSHDPRFNLL